MKKIMVLTHNCLNLCYDEILDKESKYKKAQVKNILDTFCTNNQVRLTTILH